MRSDIWAGFAKIVSSPESQTGRRRLGSGLLLVATLGLMYFPSFLEHARLSANPLIFNDDARIYIFPFYRYQDDRLFSNDYIADYCLALSPPGHRVLYKAGAALFDPAVISKVLPYILYLVLLVPTTWASNKISGMSGAWGTSALLLSSYIFMYHMAGGLPRGWGFPVMGLAALMLAYGRVVLLALLVCFSSALYPPAAVVAGISLASLLFLLPRSDRGQASQWSTGKRVCVLLMTLLVSLAVLLPELASLQSYGDRLGPADIIAYPELGPKGRYGFDDRPPFQGLLWAVGDAFGRAVQGGRQAWVPSVRAWICNGRPFGSALSTPFVLAVASMGFIALIGSIRLVIRDAASRRLTTLLAGACAGYLWAVALSPHLFLPQRYMIYPIPVLTAIFIPAAAGELSSSRTTSSGPRRPAAVIAFTLLLLVLFGGRGPDDTGMTVRAEEDRVLYQHISSLPRDILVAGWPEGATDNIPYLCRRRALISFEAHQIQHRGYAEEMRNRMRALVDGYFATSSEPLLRLRSEFRVTHLLVDLDHYGDMVPHYFEPFEDWTKQAHRMAMEKGSLVARLVEHPSVYRVGRYALLDLDKVSPVITGGGTEITSARMRRTNSGPRGEASPLLTPQQPAGGSAWLAK